MTCQGGKFICSYLLVDCNVEALGISISSRSDSGWLSQGGVTTSGMQDANKALLLPLMKSVFLAFIHCGLSSLCK